MMRLVYAALLLGMLGLAACGGGGGGGGGGNASPIGNGGLPAPPVADPDAPEVPLTPVAHLSFVDVTEDAGLDFAHGLRGNTMGQFIAGGVAVGDYNGDGKLDLFLAQGNAGFHKLYENRSQNGSFEFTDVAASRVWAVTLTTRRQGRHLRIMTVTAIWICSWGVSKIRHFVFLVIRAMAHSRK